MRRNFIIIGAVCLSAAVLSFGVFMEKGKSVDTLKPLRAADNIVTVAEEISRLDVVGEGSDEKVDPEVSETVEMDKAKEYGKKEMYGNKSSEKRIGNSQSKSTSVQTHTKAHTHNFIPVYGTRQVERTKSVPYTKCYACGADMTGNPGHIDKHLLNNEGNVHYGTEYRQEKYFVSEQYVKGYQCSCGASK